MKQTFLLSFDKQHPHKKTKDRKRWRSLSVPCDKRAEKIEQVVQNVNSKTVLSQEVQMVRSSFIQGWQDVYSQSH